MEIIYDTLRVDIVEKGGNTFEVLPGGWIQVRHSSGMPLYLHRKTRVCTVSKPYYLGPASVRVSTQLFHNWIPILTTIEHVLSNLLLCFSVIPSH